MKNEIDTYIATRAYPDTQEHCAEYTSHYLYLMKQRPPMENHMKMNDKHRPGNTVELRDSDHYHMGI